MAYDFDFEDEEAEELEIFKRGTNPHSGAQSGRNSYQQRPQYGQQNRPADNRVGSTQYNPQRQNLQQGQGRTSMQYAPNTSRQNFQQYESSKAAQRQENANRQAGSRQYNPARPSQAPTQRQSSERRQNTAYSRQTNGDQYNLQRKQNVGDKNSLQRQKGEVHQNKTEAAAQAKPNKKGSSNKKAIAVLVSIIVLIIAVFASIFAIGGRKASVSELKAENVTSGIKISWQKRDDAENYEVFKKSDKEWKQVKTTDKTAYTDKKANDGERCQYRVKAVVNSKSGNAGEVTCYRIAPIEITDSEVGENSLTITWNGSNSAEKYKIFKRMGDEEQKEIASVSSSTVNYTDTDVQPNMVYSYAVMQVTKHGQSSIENETGIATMSTVLDSASVKNSPSGVTVSWTGKVDIAIGYNIYRKTSGSDWVLAGSADKDASSFVDSGAKYGQTNKYKVCAKLSESADGEAKGAGSVYAVDPSKKLVALTYDDGPYTPVTNLILDTMEKYNSHCTFFVVGNRVETYHSCVERAVKLGCEMASHTYDHKYLNTLTDDEIKFQLDEAKKVIEKYSGTKCTLLRPPGGYAHSSVPYPEIMWSVDTMDWKNRNKDQTLANAKNGVFDGSIVLMHDLYESSANATVELVPYLIENGYQLVTVSELMDARGISMTNGVKYYQAKKSN